MQLHELTSLLSRVSDVYAKNFSIQRSDDWYLLKIQEELGELTAAFLKLSARARVNGTVNLKSNLEEEIADVLAMTLLFAKSQGVDPEKAIRNKWFKYLEDTHVSSN